MAGPGDNRTPTQKAETAIRNARWLQMKIDGKTYRQIAAIEGKSASYICEEVTKEIKKIPTENANDLRTQMLEQIDEDYQTLSVFANHICDGECEENGCTIDDKVVNNAINTRAKLREQKAKLLGLNAPVETKTSVEIIGVPAHLQADLADLNEE